MYPNQSSNGLAVTPGQSRRLVLLGLLGAYLNVVAFGFTYGTANHDFELALVNWLRDPSLYPQDPIRDAFARFPSLFWRGVAHFSTWADTKQILFVSFLLTKALFFLGLVRIVWTGLQDYRLVACIVFSTALSPFLNELTPFGASDVLSSVQTNTSLAVALLVWFGLFLIERRWLRAALLLGFTTYINGLFTIYSAFAFATFAVLDWHRQRREIMLAAVLGSLLALPWLAFSPGIIPQAFPGDYVEALLMFLPFHLTLSSHSTYDLLRGGGLLAAAICVVIVAAKAGLMRHRRLELLAASFLIPVLLGAMIGEFFLLPSLLRVQFLRADSFLLLYSMVLIQLYAGNLLVSTQVHRPATAYLLGVLGILLPLSHGLGLLLPLLAGMLFWGDPKDPLESFCRAITRSQSLRVFGVFLLAAGMVFALRTGLPWNATGVALVAVLGGFLSISVKGSAVLGPRMSGRAAAICGLATLIAAIGMIPQGSRLWSPEVALTPLGADWREVQQWAKANTPPQAKFLVPAFPCGFRVFSERTSWGEWKDGSAIYLFPPFTDAYRKRMKALGFTSGPEWIDDQSKIRLHKQQPWERLSAIARENNLSYVVQFADVRYGLLPVFANDSFAVYKVEK